VENKSLICYYTDEKEKNENFYKKLYVYNGCHHMPAALEPLCEILSS